MTRFTDFNESSIMGASFRCAMLFASLMFSHMFSHAAADIFLFADGDIKGPVENSEAAFGPPVGPLGRLGALRLAQPQDACTPLTPPSNSYGPWIALISRDQSSGNSCTFDEKVSVRLSVGLIRYLTSRWSRRGHHL